MRGGSEGYSASHPRSEEDAMNGRERGEGRVYQRGAVWWVQYCHRGRVYRETSHSTDRRDATKLLRRRLAEIVTHRHAPQAEKVTFEDLARMVEDDYRLNGRRSLGRAMRSFKHLREPFGFDRAVDITSDRLTAYARLRIEAGAAPATVANELAALKRGFSLAVRAGRLMHRPAFPIIQVDNARTGFFEEGEFRALAPELPDEVRAVVTFAYLTGWRVSSEVLPLRWAQVDLEAGVVRLEPGSTKNREGREFPVNALPELAALLTRQRELTTATEREVGAVIPFVFHRHGEPIRDFRRAWRNACKRAALVGMIPHDFRRTAVRNLERAGVPRSVAMKLVGHKTESIYRRYAIVSQRDLAEGVAKLAALRQGALGARTVVPFPGGSSTVLTQSAAVRA
jgi:integrase